MDRLDELESKSIYVLREAYKKFGKIGILWSMGKDSTVLLWLAMKAFYGHVPFPIVHIDTTFKFPEMYAFRQKLAKQWNLNLIIGINKDAIVKGINYDNNTALEVCDHLKTVALKNFVDEYKFDGLILAIRADEEGSRSKERFFSKRNADFEWEYTDQPPELWDQFNSDFRKGEHIRIHPILHWTEHDVWKYIEREGIPTISLYFAKNGKRYRSLGCMPITFPINSDASNVNEVVEELKNIKTAEREGRGQDREDAHALQKLRAKGYM
jgi:sulfate adenylyltransferase subunit 2